MSIETLIAEAVATQINARFDALERKIDATNAVLVDVNQQIRDARASLEQAIAECPCDDVAAPTPAPVPVPTPAPVPVPVDPPGSVRWRGILVTLDAQGRILFDGAMVPENSLTRDVVRVYEGADGLLWHDNVRGETYRWSARADGNWERMQTGPTVTIQGNGTIGTQAA